MGFGIAWLERKAIERTYEDTCKIIRNVQNEDKYGISSFTTKIVYSDVKCGLTMTSSTSRQDKSYNQIDFDAKLFVPPETIVKRGDEIEVERFNEILRFKSVGVVTAFKTHKEVMMKYADKYA